MARIIKMILSYETRGLGTKDDPVRHCPQLFTKHGDLVAELDPMPNGDIEHPKIYFNPAPIFKILP